ncbi:MAG TPA: sterol desaturase family protein [Enhygromyxa sp.]|nr:sterol desaturase family protein [Enhygromyxa sp.]
MANVSDARTVRSHHQALAVFMSYPSPRILAAQLVVLIRIRMHMLAAVGLASVTGWELLIPIAIVLVLWPVQEWLVHKFVLHLRPRELWGRRFDPHFAKKHRDHHADPSYLPDVFLPARVIVPLIPPTLAFWWLVMPTPELALTAMIAYVGAALHYEWVHYLSHTSVTPRTGWFRRVRRNHRYHHFKNERYWHGFTVPLVDTVLGSNPKASEVETSATARTLGVEPE